MASSRDDGVVPIIGGRMATDKMNGIF